MKGTLHHQIPSWVPQGSRFHIRIRMEVTNKFKLTDSGVAKSILTAAAFYHETQRWFLHLLVLMPDHLHGIISFPATPGMSRTIGLWKKYVASSLGVQWQRNFFDHRLRNETEFVEKAKYIRMNPVHAGLCAQAEDWPWIVDRNA